ncbi:MAG: SIS domain-containing protein [Candidatus Heimdallarchaeota archaeon]|nr:MAG: SIS domain-containing protein [Candidatus Heimdallarchaeota archaeon]
MTEFQNEPDFMLSEMLEQPRILDSIISDTHIKEIGEYLLESDVERIYITGSGDSYCAAWFGAYLGEKWHPTLDIRHYAPFEFVNYLNPKHLKKSVIIGISVSGNTPRVVEAIRFAQKRNVTTIGITDNPQGKLSRESDHALFIHASPSESLETTAYTSKGARDYIGYHHDVAQTKTYLGNLAVLSLLMAHSSQESPDHLRSIQQTFQLVSSAIQQRQKYLDLSKEIGKNTDKIFFIASGPNRPTGLFGSYKMFEFTLNGFACDIEEYCHTGYFITTEKTSVIFLVPDNYSMNRIMEIEPVVKEDIKANCTILVNSILKDETESNSIPLSLPDENVLSPMIFTIPVEFISYSIAKTGGFDTNRFRGGRETEKYVSGSYKTIRKSKLWY